MLAQLLHNAEPWLAQYGNAALFAVMFLEGVGIPAPGLTFLIASVLLVDQGTTSLAAIAAAGAAGYIGGCQTAFLIGRTGGRRLLLRSGILNRHRLRRLHGLFARRGILFLVVAPFFDGSRQYASLVAGTADTAWYRFALSNLAGTLMWIGTWTTATAVFGHDIEPIIQYVHHSTPWLLGAVLAAAIALLVYWLIHRRQA